MKLLESIKKVFNVINDDIYLNCEYIDCNEDYDIIFIPVNIKDGYVKVEYLDDNGNKNIFFCSVIAFLSLFKRK